MKKLLLTLIATLCIMGCSDEKSKPTTPPRFTFSENYSPNPGTYCQIITDNKTNTEYLMVRYYQRSVSICPMLKSDKTIKMIDSTIRAEQ